ncbi:MAG: hypothetical protein Q9200_003291 [Gallowayella weberi]
MPRQVVALAGAGSLGRYVCEAFLDSPDFDIVILTRSLHGKWFSDLDIPIQRTDYNVDSLTHILNDVHATIFISFIQDSSPSWLSTHQNILSACHASNSCKRLIPSEWIGDIETFPLKPDFYGKTREPFRQMLRDQNGRVEWTCVCPGWLMDYFLPSGGNAGRKKYMKPIPDEFPVDPDGWKALIRGTGEEAQSWTSARDIADAVVELCKAEKGIWEEVTYVAGEWSNFNAAIATVESHRGKTMPKTYKSWEEIAAVLETPGIKDEEALPPEVEIAQVEEMTVKSYLAVPREKTLRQRHKFFGAVRFRNLEELLKEEGD